MTVRGRRRLFAAVLTVPILLCAIGFAWLVGAFTDTSMAFPRPFSARTWKAADPDYSDVRCRMTFDLRHRIGLTGRTAAEVLQLLGDEREGRPGNPEYYVLCTDLVDYMVLELTWRDGRVVSSRTYQS